jgi:ATP-dependent DNA helicase RecQ
MGESMLGPSRTHPFADLLHRVFGHSEFRAHQQGVCEAAASGRDVLLVMPTGAGKSLCYQLPALARGGAGLGSTGLVISPLIALMDDQAAKLAALGLRVARVHSGLSREDARQACRDYLAGTLDFLFIAPERMRVPGFPEMLAKRKPALIAIDEAHCISQWGHDFRPDYRTLGQSLKALRAGPDGSPIIALTATATPAVQRDIVRQLEVRDPAIFITGFRRENLAVEVLQLSKPQRAEFTEKMLSEAAARPAIVYAASRKTADELAVRLNTRFPAQAYHAGLDAATRERVQRGFSTGEVEVVVATIAFGMGVDKADVRTVVHVALPGSVEAFYQEIGRAGRDGLASRSMLLYSFADRKTQEFLLERNYPARSELERVARALDEDFIEIDELQSRLKLDRETLDRAIEKLVAQGVAVTDWNGVRATGEGGWQEGYDAQVAARREQIDRMMAFAEGSGCRMNALVEHFGDRSDAMRACGRCDVCEPSGVTGAAMRQADAREREWLRSILTALANRSTSTGKLFTELALMKDRKTFDALLDGLARAGLITVVNDTFRAPDGRDVTYRKASVTHEGRTPDEATLDTVWIRGESLNEVKAAGARRERRPRERSRAIRVERPRAREPKRILEPRNEVVRSSNSRERSVVLTRQPVAAASAPPDREFDERQRQIEERLRAWRKEQARVAGLPSFFIFSDTVLREIVVAAPGSMAELRSVRGVGPEKLERFGADVVEICQA